MTKKIFMLFAILITLFSLFSTNYALTTIHEKEETEILTSGALLKKYTRFTDKGFLKINIIEVDLEDNNTKVGLLNSENGLSTFQTVYQMANKDNIVAAINGDFFNGNYKKGNTIGLSISEGELLTSTYYENEIKDTFASLIIDEDTNAWFDYFTGKMIFKNEKNNDEFLIAEVNKLSSNYEYPVVYTRAWGEKSLGSSEEFIITEIVVDNGKIKDIRYNEEAVEIPENGFVIAVSGKTAEDMKESLKNGNKISFDIDISLDINKINLAISGGAMLVENGVVPETFSANISGSNPRTAVGLSKDGRTMYLITVDGRQRKSIGMTQKELADFLVEKGIYNALNLDGGGSTTMIARKLGNSFIETINSPSGGTLRMVTNAIGIYNTNKTSSLSELVLKVPEENVFVGCERNIEVLGYDKYYNPVEVDFDDIDWEIEGVSVTIEKSENLKNNNENEENAKKNIGKIIAGEEAGTAKIIAKKGRIKTSISIDILSIPNEIEISPKNAVISIDENITFDVIAKNKNGYYASIKADELNLEVISGEGIFNDYTYTPNIPGEHLIKISVGNAVTYAYVKVNESNKILLNDFEMENFKFVSYPLGVDGNAEISREEAYEGKKSAKLEYDFSKIEATRAAYIRFDEQIEIPEDACSINVMAYSEESQNEYIKLKLIDAKGITQLVTMTKSITAGEWKEEKCDLSSIALPAILTDIYVAQDNINIKNSGTIYFDNLEIEVTDSYEESSSNIELPESIKGIDSANKESELSRDESFKFAILDKITKPKTLLEQLTNKKMEKNMSENAEMIIFTAVDNGKENLGINLPIIECGSYKKEKIENTTIITIDISNGGIRTTDFEQWINMQMDIKEDENKNIVILMNGSLEDFTDENERKLFIDVLCELKRKTLKNILVIHGGEKTTYKMERGIRYLILDNEWLSNKDELMKAVNKNYILVTVAEDGITYEIKNAFLK